MRAAARWAAVLLSTAAGPAIGAEPAFPVRPVKIVTAEPGGGNDLAARILAQELTRIFGQQVIVESRGGGNGALAAQAVSKAAPDGYTLLLYSSALWVIPLLSDVGWDVLRDFAPAALLAQAPNVLVVHPSLPARSVADLVQLAKARPGELNYSTGASASAAHLSGELFKALSRTDIVRVRYKGTGPGLVALVSGEVQIMFPAAGSVVNYMKSGKLRALGVTSASRSALVPELPTLAEAGLRNYEAVSVYALFAPARTPPAVMERVSESALRALQAGEVKQRFLAAGVETIGGGPQRLDATVRSDIARWGKLIRAAGIRED